MTGDEFDRGGTLDPEMGKKKLRYHVRGADVEWFTNLDEMGAPGLGSLFLCLGILVVANEVGDIIEDFGLAGVDVGSDGLEEGDVNADAVGLHTVNQRQTIRV